MKWDITEVICKSISSLDGPTYTYLFTCDLSKKGTLYFCLYWVKVIKIRGQLPKVIWVGQLDWTPGYLGLGEFIGQTKGVGWNQQTAVNVKGLIKS